MIANDYFITSKKATLEVGFVKALLLQTIDFFTEFNKKSALKSVLIDGEYFMYHSFKQWSAHLDGLIQPRAAIRHLLSLEADGFIVIIRADAQHQANYYRLTSKGKALITPTPKEGAKVDNKPEDSTPATTPKPKPVSAPKPAPTRPCATITNDGLASEDSTLIDALNDFIKYRKQLGKYTALSHKALINKINKVIKEGAEVDVVIDAIYKSIECGWRGVFFDSKQSGLIATGAGGWADGVKILANGSVLCADGTKRAVNHDGRTGADIMKYFPDPVYMEV